MTQSVFDRETLLDLTVNAIPLFILLFFIVVFAVMNPFGSATVIQAIQFSIVGVMFVALALLTYYSGKAIATAEYEMEAESTAEHERELEVAGEAAELETGEQAAELETAEESAELEAGDEPVEATEALEDGSETDE